MKLKVAVLAGVSVASVASGGLVALPGGWQAQWDASLDPFVDIQAIGVVGDALFIQKSAEFTQAPPFPGFPFPTIPITFMQTDPNAVSNIVIDDEIITNSTGVDWLDFHMTLLDGDDVFFDPVATANSGGGGPIGFFIEPFTNAQFTDNNQQLDIDGGVVPDGTTWFPGNGATNGQLWININTGDGVNKPLTTFVLKETPSVPAPGVATLLVGGIAIAGRRRR